jgi:hypothetical protein
LTESATHRAWKDVLCGCGSDVEVPFGAKKRLDCVNPKLSACGEVELTRSRIPRDISKLTSMRAAGGCNNPVLAVRPSDYQYARGLARKKGIQVVEATPWNLTIRQVSCTVTSKRLRRF